MKKPSIEKKVKTEFIVRDDEIGALASVYDEEKAEELAENILYYKLIKWAICNIHPGCELTKGNDFLPKEFRSWERKFQGWFGYEPFDLYDYKDKMLRYCEDIIAFSKEYMSLPSSRLGYDNVASIRKTIEKDAENAKQLIDVINKIC